MCGFGKAHLLLFDMRGALQCMRQTLLTERPGSYFNRGKDMDQCSHHTLGPSSPFLAAHLVFQDSLDETMDRECVGVGIPLDKRVSQACAQCLIQFEWIDYDASKRRAEI